MVKELIGYSGELKFNSDKPDGTPRKLLDVSKIHGVGWKHQIDLREGIQKVIIELETKKFDFTR